MTKFKQKDILNPRKVTEFVLAAHHDFERVQEMVEDDARVVNATLDMGNGDWESALDAAAHMGRKDIARYLIENGARLDFLYLSAMIDEVEIVKSILTAFSMAKDVKGVHGFPLRHFAEFGNAEAVLAYLDTLD
jgi:hypothetical protein